MGVRIHIISDADADPEPAFGFDADPDPAYHADADPASQK